MLSDGLIEPLRVDILKSEINVLLLLRLIFGFLNDLSLTLNIVKSISSVNLVLLILLFYLFYGLLFHVKHVFKVTRIVAREIHLRIDS
jgi:hypothetical protein